jgi:hypothetical protein
MLYKHQPVDSGQQSLFVPPTTQSTQLTKRADDGLLQQDGCGSAMDGESPAGGLIDRNVATLKTATSLNYLCNSPCF